MRLSDIVVRLASQVSRYTEHFHDVLTYTSVEIGDDGLVTVTTPSPHGLVTGQYITVTNMEVQRNVILLTHDDEGVAVAELDSDHDLTRNYQQTVKISGAAQAQFNGIHELIDVPNRRYFTYKVDKDAPDIASGPIKFHEVLEYGYDGAYSITVLDATHFTFVLTNTSLLLDGFNGTISINQRIFGCVDLDRFIELYEKQLSGRYTMVVCMDDAQFSKNRNVLSDAIDATTRSSDIRQGLMEPFSVYVFIPTASDPFGVTAVDTAYHVIRPAVFQSLIGVVFEEALDEPNQYGVSGMAHGMNGYNKAYYVHQYKFETYKEVTIEDSAVGPGKYAPTRAFRDIIVQMQNSYLEILQETAINLDDYPIYRNPDDDMLELEGGNVLSLEEGFGSDLTLE